MSIAAILSGKGHDVIQIGSDATLRDAVKLLVDKRIGCVPVVDHGQVVGILSERDVVRLIGERGADVLEAIISSVMTSPAVTIEPDTHAISALSLMTRRRVRHLPVIENGEMIGFVSIGDLVKYRIDQIEAEAEAMREYIQGT